MFNFAYMYLAYKKGPKDLKMVQVFFFNNSKHQGDFYNRAPSIHGRGYKVFWSFFYIPGIKNIIRQKSNTNQLSTLIKSTV